MVIRFKIGTTNLTTPLSPMIMPALIVIMDGKNKISVNSLCGREGMGRGVGRLGWRSSGDWRDRGARWLLAAVFLAASVPKMLDPNAFAATIGAYGLLPEGFLFPAAILLCWGNSSQP